MSELKVNHELLASGIETGIGHLNHRLATLEPGNRLRGRADILASAAIYSYANDLGVPTSLHFMRRGTLPFNDADYHVLPLLDTSSEDPLIIDAAYSQILRYAGITIDYEKQVAATPCFPPEKIIDFKASKHSYIATQLTDIVKDFQKTNVMVPDNFEVTIKGSGPLTGLTRGEIYTIFNKVWDISNYEPWNVPNHTLKEGAKISEHIPKGAITLEK